MTSIFALQFPIINHRFLVCATFPPIAYDPYLCKLSVVLYLSWLKWIIRKQIAAEYCLKMNRGLTSGKNIPWCGGLSPPPTLFVCMCESFTRRLRVSSINYSEPVIVSTPRAHAIGCLSVVPSCVDSTAHLQDVTKMFTVLDAGLFLGFIYVFTASFVSVFQSLHTNVCPRALSL